jgi:hypothetical protein
MTPLQQGAEEDAQEQILSYLMLECSKCGLVPLCHSADG